MRLPGAHARLATTEDLPDVLRLRLEWTEEQAGEQIDDPDFGEALAVWWEREQHQRVLWLGFADGVTRPVGMLNLMVFTRMPRPRAPGRATGAGQWGYVANVYVAPRHRDDGVGAAMLEACCAWADDRGLLRLVLNPTERSVPLYARAGFAPATSLMLRPGPS